MPEPQQRICRLADEAAAAKEPEAALRTLRDLRAELVDFERSRVAEALRSGSSFGDVAKALGISRQAAHRRYRDLAPADAKPLSLSSHARRVLDLARREAAATHAHGVGSEHLLLGVLKSGGAASRALEAEGVSAAAVRQCLGTVDGEPAASAADHNGGGRAVLAEAAEIAKARRASFVDADHIALAALTGSDGGALRAITALGVPATAVRERLSC